MLATFRNCTLRSVGMASILIVGVISAAFPSRSQGRNALAANPSPPTTITNVIPPAAAAILEQPDRFELLALNPHRQVQQETAEADYHGYKVIATIAVNDLETRSRLVSSFERAVTDNQGTIGACFNPRHGIRVTRNRKQVEFVICFECNQVRVFGAVRGEFLITNSAQPIFDAVLRKGNPREDSAKDDLK